MLPPPMHQVSPFRPLPPAAAVSAAAVAAAAKVLRSGSTPGLSSCETVGSPSFSTPLTPASASLQQRMVKTKLCVHHLNGRCARGAYCTFAHSGFELRTAPDLYKTRLCINYANTGQCHKGDACKFAHGKTELRNEDCASEDGGDELSCPKVLAGPLESLELPPNAIDCLANLEDLLDFQDCMPTSSTARFRRLDSVEVLEALLATLADNWDDQKSLQPQLTNIGTSLWSTDDSEFKEASGSAISEASTS